MPGKKYQNSASGTSGGMLKVHCWLPHIEADASSWPTDGPATVGALHVLSSSIPVCKLIVQACLNTQFAQTQAPLKCFCLLGPSMVQRLIC